MTGPEIRDVRESLGLTQAQLAAILGVHAVTVCRWETEVQSPTPYQIGLIQQFARAARRQDVAKQVATVLVTAGAIAGLFFLLKWAIEQDEAREQTADAYSRGATKAGHGARRRAPRRAGKPR